MTPFVPASRLYDVNSGTTIEHPTLEATDDDVRRALEGVVEAEVAMLGE